jgi:ATP-binding cassette subfamily B protein
MYKFHHYKQLDQMDCGPTCLRMVAKHYGRLLSVQTLREKSKIAKDGTSLLGIADAAESVGFRTMGVQVELDKLTSEVALPCILYWQQNHYVVLYAVKKPASWMGRLRGGRLRTQAAPAASLDSIHDFSSAATSANWGQGATRPPVVDAKEQGTFFVADPAKGLISYTSDEFRRRWLTARQEGRETGIALLLEPTSAFYEQEDEKAGSYGFAQLLRYFWQHKQLLIQLALALLVASGLQLLLPFLTQSIVDVGINSQNIPFLYLILAAQFVLTVSRLAVEFVRGWILLYISTRLNLSILSDFFIKLMRLPLSFFDTKQFGDIMQRVSDHHRIESFLTGQTISMVFSFLNLMVFSVVLVIYSKTIFLIFVIGSLLYLGWIRLFLQRRRQLDFKRFDASATSQSMLIQLIQGMQEIKLAGAERPMRWDWERVQVRLFRLQMQGLSLSQYQQVGAFALNEGKNILITFLAARAVIQGQLTLGGMLALQYIVGQVSGPIDQMVAFVQNLQDAKISLERLNDIHSLTDEEPDAQLLVPLPDFAHPAGLSAAQQTLHLRNVSFQYPGAGLTPILQNINLSVFGGRTTAIVGMSGSGKTTLLKLLLKFYPPGEGDILLGETSLQHVSHASWRQQCGVVMQDGFIFSDTIARNIAVGNERIDAQRLTHAVYVANLNDFIDGLPLGLHTKIGSEGNGVSQGQRQRILIARAVYKNPQYIFFDEATNSLDANNEAIITERLQDFFRRRTVIIVAHRLSTVSHADQIVVVDKGHITEAGTHASLIAKRGDYWNLVKNQLELGM